MSFRRNAVTEKSLTPVIPGAISLSRIPATACPRMYLSGAGMTSLMMISDITTQSLRWNNVNGSFSKVLFKIYNRIKIFKRCFYYGYGRAASHSQRRGSPFSNNNTQCCVNYQAEMFTKTVITSCIASGEEWIHSVRKSQKGVAVL